MKEIYWTEKHMEKEPQLPKKIILILESGWITNNMDMVGTHMQKQEIFIKVSSNMARYAGLEFINTNLVTHY